MSRRAGTFVVNGIGLLAAMIFAFPVYWMFNSAFKPSDQLQNEIPVFIPSPPTLDNFARALNVQYFPDFLRNSVVVTISTVLLALLVGLLAAVAMARTRFRGRGLFLLLVAIAQMAPFEALLIPMFLTINDIGLYNNILSLIIIYFIFTLPFTIWSLRGFISGIPVDLEEAAQVDGASRLGAFWRVTLPLLAPGLVATSIFCFITAWNEYLYAYTLMTDSQNYTLPVWLGAFRTNLHGTDWGATMAASTLFTLPVLIFFLIVQNKMVGGLTAGAVKG